MLKEINKSYDTDVNVLLTILQTQLYNRFGFSIITYTEWNKNSRNVKNWKSYIFLYKEVETVCLLNVVKYPLAELLVPILIIKDSLTRIVVVHQLIVLRRPNKLHVSILTSNVYHFLLLLFSLFSFLHALNCFPSDAIAHRLTTSTKYWEWI